MGLADRLQERTAALHREAERSGFFRAMLQGRASREGYALFLFNLLPAYRELERRLEGGRGGDAAASALALTALYRSAAIEADLRALCGGEEGQRPPLLSEGAAYRDRVAAAAGGGRLLAHAYVRYLGDLNGGRILRRVLARAPGLEPEALGFYDFPGVADADRFAASCRAAVDRVELGDAEPAALDEACAAFELNIRLSQAVAAAAGW
jgi:heme oxygenase (biliverdin-producing, ferredoxin)